MSEHSGAAPHGELGRVGVMLCLTVLVFALSLALTSCGASKRVQRSSAPLEERLDTLSDVEQYPVMIKQGRPKYPRKAKEAGWEGTVWVGALIDTEGKVRNVRIRESSGYKELDDAAAIAAWKNKFKPGVQHGKRVWVWVTYKVEFSIGHKKSHGN